MNDSIVVLLVCTDLVFIHVVIDGHYLNTGVLVVLVNHFKSIITTSFPPWVQCFVTLFITPWFESSRHLLISNTDS